MIVDGIKFGTWLPWDGVIAGEDYPGEHSGVDAGTPVRVAFRKADSGSRGTMGSFSWVHVNDNQDIVAFQCPHDSLIYALPSWGLREDPDLDFEAMADNPLWGIF